MQHSSRKDEYRRPPGGEAFVLVVGAAAALVAAWLAGRVADRGGLAPEVRTEGALQRLPRSVKVAGYATSAFAYPVVYFPLSVWIAVALRRRGARTPEVVPRAALPAWVTHHVAKWLVHRERPASEQGRANDERSYPSGHATAATAIALATVLASRSSRSDERSVVRLAVAAPLLVGAGRLALRKHWPTDVIGGWATGVAVAAYVTEKHRPAAQRSGGAAHAR